MRTIADANSARAGQDFDIYVLDVIVPDGNGLRLARELSRQSRAGIILLTGQGEETDRVVGLEIGADDYIVKPFCPRELRARVNAVHRRISSGPQPVQAPPANAGLPEAPSIPFHGLELFSDSRTLRGADGVEIELTTLEFDVLLVLVRHANRVIMDEVKGQDWSAYDRAVDGLISRIRTKLYPDESGARQIRTIRSIGYMMGTTDKLQCGPCHRVPVAPCSRFGDLAPCRAVAHFAPRSGFLAGARSVQPCLRGCPEVCDAALGRASISPGGRSQSLQTVCASDQVAGPSFRDLDLPLTQGAPG